MISNIEIKKNAKKLILTDYTTVISSFIIYFAYFFIVFIILQKLSTIINFELVLLLGVVLYIMILPFHVGISGLFLEIYKKENKIKLNTVFEIGFKNCKHNLITLILKSFKLFIWSLIGLIPLYYGIVLTLMSSFQGSPLTNDHTGLNNITYVIFIGTIIISIIGFIPYIVKSISYSMTSYILAKNNDISALETIKLSKTMTSGHKMEIFKMCLSFIGWILLSIITLGIGWILWTGPYMSASFAIIYEKLKNI